MELNITEKDGVITGTYENAIILARFYKSNTQLNLYAIKTSNLEQAKTHLEMQKSFITALETLEDY